MPLCSVHTTVTLNVASRLASAVSLEETPACHENQDYLNLFSWRSFTQTFPALSRKLVFFTACGRLWWVSGITDVRTHAHASHAPNNCLYTQMRTCTKAWLSPTDDLKLSGGSRSSRPAGVAAGLSAPVCFPLRRSTQLSRRWSWQLGLVLRPLKGPLCWFWRFDSFLHFACGRLQFDSSAVTRLWDAAASQTVSRQGLHPPNPTNWTSNFLRFIHSI